MDTPTPPAPAPAYHDRRTWLIVFGVLEIILGGLCALMLPLTILGQVMAARKNDGHFNFAMAAPGVFLFAAVSTGLIWLGVGSTQCRRWARSLLLCFSWMGLCIGLVSLVVLAFGLGSMDEVLRQRGQELPPGAATFAKIAAVTMVGVIYVLIPGVLVLFYRSPHVKATCEHRDPVERWTDRCPLPVVAMCILQAYGAACTIFMPWFGGAMPLFGLVVTGWTARLLWVGFAALSLYAARGFYRLDRRAWLIYTVAVTFVALSSIVTFLQVDLLEYYRLVGLPEWQIRQMAASPLMKGNFMLWITAPVMALFIGYLLFIRRYFPAAQPAA